MLSSVYCAFYKRLSSAITPVAQTAVAEKRLIITQQNKNSVGAMGELLYAIIKRFNMTYIIFCLYEIALANRKNIIPENSANDNTASYA